MCCWWMQGVDFVVIFLLLKCCVLLEFDVVGQFGCVVYDVYVGWQFQCYFGGIVVVQVQLVEMQQGVEGFDGFFYLVVLFFVVYFVFGCVVDVVIEGFFFVEGELCEFYVWYVYVIVKQC